MLFWLFFGVLMLVLFDFFFDRSATCMLWYLKFVVYVVLFVYGVLVW